MRKFLTALLILLLGAALFAGFFLLKDGGKPAAVVPEPGYDEELYQKFREAEIRGDFTAMNSAYDKNMKETGVSFTEGDYDPTHGGLIYVYDYSAAVGSKNTVKGKLCVVSDKVDRAAQTMGENDYFALDRRTGVSDPEFVVYDSYRADTDGVIRALCGLLLEHEAAHPTDWDRSLESMVSEWKMHNLAYLMGYKVGHSQHVNLNNGDEGTDWLSRAIDELS